MVGEYLCRGKTNTNITVAATDPEGDTIAYSETTSNLSGAGFSLNSSSGLISGTAAAVSGDTTTSFTLRPTSGGQTADCETWNGSSWTEVNNLNTARSHQLTTGTTTKATRTTGTQTTGTRTTGTRTTDTRTTATRTTGTRTTATRTTSTITTDTITT